MSECAADRRQRLRALGEELQMLPAIDTADAVHRDEYGFVLEVVCAAGETCVPARPLGTISYNGYGLVDVSRQGEHWTAVVR